jgi:hypothetical protein
VHPLLPREPFPVDLVRGLHSRTERDFKALLATRPPNLGRKESRAWAENSRIEKLGSLELELKSAVYRAELAGAGSEEQALAWEGFDRVAHSLALREDLSAAESGLVQMAQTRRSAKRASTRRSAPGTRGVFSDSDDG